MSSFPPAPTYLNPINKQTGDFEPAWLQWFLQVGQFISNNGGGSTVVHNALSGLQGGASGQYYHLDATHYGIIEAFPTTTFSGTFKTGDIPQRTVTVVNGIITSVA